jgi:hypothetical protein
MWEYPTLEACINFIPSPQCYFCIATSKNTHEVASLETLMTMAIFFIETYQDQVVSTTTTKLLIDPLWLGVSVSVS